MLRLVGMRRSGAYKVRDVSGRRRSGWAVLAVGALLASLLAAGSAPAGAAEIKVGNDNMAMPDKLPDFSACVGDAERDAGFEDTAGLEAEAAINCLAYYGITKGKTAERFDAGSEVTRSQMALFLYRAADVAGLNLMGGDGAADFDDIDDLDEDRQTAIKALARNNILSGSGMAFNPDVSITRAQMAVALIGFLKHASPNLFHRSGEMRGRLILASGETLDHFADAQRSLPRGQDAAVSYAYELGITRGSAAGANVFSPEGPVLRKNMASFITRTLAHTNVRPAGLTAQDVSGTITASIRDAEFAPVGNEIVDGFYIATASEARAFGSLGECRPAVKAVDGGSGKCVIEAADPATNADGNAEVGSMDAAAIGKGATVWVWTGDTGDRFDADRVDAFKLLLTPQAAVSATKMTVTPAKPAQARFDSEVTFTAQLQYTDSSSGADRDTKVGSDGKARARYSLQREVLDANGATVSKPAAELIWSDAQGRITFGVTTADPNPSAASTRTVKWTLTAVTNAPAASPLTNQVVFSDAASKPTTVKAVPTQQIVVVPAAGATAPNAVTATVLDQYGAPMRNVALTVTSDTDRSEMPSRRHTTASSGSVRIPYTHRGGPAVIETLTVTHTPASGTAVSGPATVYWVQRVNWASEDTPARVLGGDVGSDTVVVDGDTGAGVRPSRVRYDGNDVFKLNGELVTMAEFEAALAKVLDTTRNPRVTGALKWSSYVSDDDSDIAEFDLVTPAPHSSADAAVGQVAAESVSVTANDPVVRATKMVDAQKTTSYEMKFGDWSYFDVQLLFTDENDGDKVKRAKFGTDGTNPVTLQATQRNTAGRVTSVTGVRRQGPAVDNTVWNPLTERLSVTCNGVACPTWSPISGPELVTDDNGAARFTVAAPADPNPGDAGDVMTLLVRVHEELNGPRANTNNPASITNGGLHYFIVRVTEGARATTGTPTTTTVPSGNAAASWTVKSVGAATDKTFPIATGAGNAALGTTYVDSKFGDMVRLVVQLKDSSGADTTAGVDGTNPANFHVHRILVYNYLTQLKRLGAQTQIFWTDPAGAVTSSSNWDEATTREGNLNVLAWHADPEPNGQGNKASLGFAIRAKANAPGATTDMGTTRIAYAMVRIYETLPSS